MPDRSTNLLGSLGVVTALHPSRRKDIRAFLPAGVQLAKNRSWVVSTGLLCFMAIALLAACNGGERSTLGLTAEPTATPMPTPEPTPALTLTPLPDLPEPVTKEMMDAGPDTYGFTSLQERIFHSDVVARARLKSIEVAGRKSCIWNGYWIPVVEFRFDVIEFLKGEGGQSLSAKASFGVSGSSWSGSSHRVYESQRDATAAAAHYLTTRNDQWDDREAILFLEEQAFWDAECGEATPRSTESYGFTLAGHAQAPQYRIESDFNRAWLPSSNVSSPPAQSRSFLLGDRSTQVAADSAARDSGTISLDELRGLIEELEESIRLADEQSVLGYKDCLAAMYARERENQGAIAAGGSLIRYWRPHHVPPPRRERIVFSGLPAKKVVVGKVWSYFGRHPLENTRDRVWLTGADAHLFRLGTDKAEHGVSYQITAVRSLPRGIYRFQLRRQEARFQPCDYYDSLAAIDYVVEAMAPPGVVSEAFFNPVRDGSRLGVDLSPNPPMRSGLGVGTRGEGRGTRRSALDSDKWGRWRPLVGVGGADGGPGQRRWGGVGGTACKGRQSRTGPVRLCGVVE